MNLIYSFNFFPFFLLVLVFDLLWAAPITLLPSFSLISFKEMENIIKVHEKSIKIVNTLIRVSLKGVLFLFVCILHDSDWVRVSIAASLVLAACLILFSLAFVLPAWSWIPRFSFLFTSIPARMPIASDLLHISILPLSMR